MNSWCLSTYVALLVASIYWSSTVAAFDSPTAVETWCGKAYRATNASFNPGGWLDEPKRSPQPLLSLTAYPRMSLYLAHDTGASVVVDAVLSHVRGEAYVNDSEDEENGFRAGLGVFSVDVKVTESGRALVSGARVPINTTENEIEFSLQDIPARQLPYDISITATTESGTHVYRTSTKLNRLPPPNTNSSSVSILDNLYGGMLIQSGKEWKPVFPFSYYISWGGWLRESLSNLDVLVAAGYNMIHVVPDCGLENRSFNFTELIPFLNRCDEIGLYIQYDMRCTYQNDTMLKYQLDLLKQHKSLLLWYTADEPDGDGHPVNSTAIAYNTIRRIDPYHPVSLVLNCDNFHYREYSSGADIIMSDVYPVGANTTFSRVFQTPCNVTYGCCGCDNCIGSLEDVAIRLEKFRRYQEWLDAPRKTFWAVPQAFGKELHWDRYPTGEEVAAMTMLSVNHGAKGVVSWVYPSQADIMNSTSQLAKALKSNEVAALLLGANPVPAEVRGANRVDAATWTLGTRMLISIVSLEATGQTRDIEIALPGDAAAVVATPWGANGWAVDGDRLHKRTLKALECSLILVELEGREEDEYLGDDTEEDENDDDERPVEQLQHPV